MELVNLEKKERPKIKFDFLFSAHSNAEDAKKLKDKIKECDVYAPEFTYGKVPEDVLKKAFKDLSEGLIDPDVFINLLAQHDTRTSFLLQEYDFFKVLLESIYKSEKKILSIDLSDKEMLKIVESGDPDLQNKVYQLRNIPSSFIQLAKQGNIEAALNKFKIYLETLVKINIQAREKIVLQKLKKELDILIENDPKLKMNPEIKVLVSFGSAHTSLGHTLQKEGYNVEREFNKMPYIYSISHEIVRRMMFNKEIPEGAYKQGLAEMMIVSLLIKANREKSTEEVFSTVRKFISSLSVSEIDELLKDIKNQQTKKILDRIYNFTSKA